LSLAGLVFARTLTRPLRQLTEGVEEVGRGNLEHRVGTAAKDEIGELSRSFDRMTENLRSTMVSRDELAKSEERLRIGASSANDLIWDWEIASGRLYWYGDLDHILGYPSGAFPRTLEAWEGAIHRDDVVRIRTALEQHLNEGKPYSVKYRIRGKDGRYHFWTDRGTALIDSRGKAYRMVGACSDITKRKRSEMELKRLNERLISSNKELEQFAYVASHDLQEPLRMVASYTQLLARRYGDTLDQDAKDFIGYAVDGANRMQRLIQDLLAYSRVTTRGGDMVPMDAHEVFGEAVKNLQAAIQESGALVS